MMGANSLLHSLRHLLLILSGPGAFFGLIFASSVLTSSNCSVIGCPFSLFRVSNSSARSWTRCLFIRDFQDGESISEVIFWIRCQSEGQIRGQKSHLLVQPLAYLRIQDECIY